MSVLVKRLLANGELNGGDRIIFREAGDVFDIAYGRKYPNTPVR